MKFFTCLKLTTFIAAGLLWTDQVATAEQILYPELDGFIRSAGEVSIPDLFRGQGILVGDTGELLENRYMNALFKFDLSGIDSGREIASVSLVLTSRKHSGSESPAPATFELYGCKREFSNAANWRSYASGKLWELSGGRGENDIGPLLSSQTISTTDYKTAGRTLELASSEAFVEEVKRAQRSGEPLYLWLGLTGRDSESTERHILDLASMEYENQNYHPQLIITYTSR